MSVRGRLFAALYDRIGPAADAAGVGRLRATLLAQARGRVLELGAGTGLNLPRYGPAVTSLVLTEPEEPMARRLRRRLAESGREAEVVLCPAEATPFPDDSFDTVVATLVLCTVADVERTLAEVARVLAPGGRLLALEHVRSDDPRIARWQDRLARPWGVVGHGCRPNQDTGALLRASALEVQRLEPTRLPGAPITRPGIVAIAIAP